MKIAEILTSKKQVFEKDVAEVTHEVLTLLETLNLDSYTEGFRIEYYFTRKTNPTTKKYGNTLFRIPVSESSYTKKVYRKALEAISSESDMITLEDEDENAFTLSVKPLF